MNELITIEDMNKWYGDFHVLKNINLKILKGEKVVICGPSGSGKSTLVRCLNHLEKHQNGKVVVLGIEINEKTAEIEKIRARVGMVFQQFNLFPHLTILENLTLAPLWAKNIPEIEASKRAIQALKSVKIADQSAKFPHQLSGGQQQRVAIARALCMEPEIMLFDEPTSSLDPEMVKEVLDVMVDLSNQGMTMICVTHEMSFAKQVADRLIFMDEGKIVEDTTPKQFFQGPSSQRGREFLSQII